MKHIWPVIALFLLGGCDAPVDQASAPHNAAAAPVEAAAAAPQNDYPPGYAEMKVAGAIFAKENFGAFKREMIIDDETGKEGIFYEIIDCLEASYNAEMDASADPKDLALESLAREIARHRHFLSQLYAPAVWEEPLRDYEKKSLERIAAAPPPQADTPENSENDPDGESIDEGGGLEKELAQAIEARRQRLQPDTIHVSLGGGCGAGEVAYLVKTEPSDGRLWMTTKFSFDVCRANKQNPWNIEACRWTEISATEPAYLSGRYVYQAKWRNGAQRRGVRAFDGLLDPEKGDQIHVVIKAA